MNAAYISFSRPKLIQHSLVALGMGGAGILMSLGASDRELMRSGHILRLLGPEGIRMVLAVCALFFLAAAIGVIRRLLEDRPLAAIRGDGIELNGVFMSRYIPWRCLEELRLRAFGRTKVSLFIHAASRCPAGANPLHHFLANRSYGVSMRLADASDEAAAKWVRDALAARSEALAPRQPSAPACRPRREPTKVAFGRRTG